MITKQITPTVKQIVMNPQGWKQQANRHIVARGIVNTIAKMDVDEITLTQGDVELINTAAWLLGYPGISGNLFSGSGSCRNTTATVSGKTLRYAVTGK